MNVTSLVHGICFCFVLFVWLFAVVVVFGISLYWSVLFTINTKFMNAAMIFSYFDKTEGVRNHDIGYKYQNIHYIKLLQFQKLSLSWHAHQKQFLTMSRWKCVILYFTDLQLVNHVCKPNPLPVCTINSRWTNRHNNICSPEQMTLKRKFFIKRSLSYLKDYHTLSCFKNVLYVLHLIVIHLSNVIHTIIPSIKGI